MGRLSQSLLTAVLSVAAGTALSDTFAVGPWQGKLSWSQQGGALCIAHATMEEKPRQTRLYFSLSLDHDVHMGLKRQGWGLSTAVPYTVTVSIGDVQVAKKSVVAPSADLLVINLPSEAAVRSVLERGTVLSIDTGTEIFKYPLTDMQPLLAALDSCVAARVQADTPPPRWAQAARPPPGSAYVTTPDSQTTDTSGPTLEQRCDGYQDFVIYHGSWDQEPTEEERAGLRQYTQDVAPCVSVWKARCAPIPLFPLGSTTAFCDIQADYARAHLNNRREFEARRETYSQYNNRADEIDRIFKEATDSFFATVQKPIDEYNERQRREQDAQDRRAAARREQELIDALRQLPRPITTECVGGNGSVQCITH